MLTAWNQTCAETASAIDTLLDIFIETINEAANNSANYLVNITKTFPFNSNTDSIRYLRYNVTSAIDTLYLI